MNAVLRTNIRKSSVFKNKNAIKMQIEGHERQISHKAMRNTIKKKQSDGREKVSGAKKGGSNVRRFRSINKNQVRVGEIWDNSAAVETL